MAKHSEISERFSYMVNVRQIFSSPKNFIVEANVHDCEKLARQWEVLSVESLYADVHLSSWKRIGIRVKGVVHARVVQTCVITLEPVLSKIEESLGCIFVPDSSKLLYPKHDSSSGSGKNIAEVRGPDILPFSDDGIIDIGSMVADTVAVAVNPYPRKEGVSFSDIS
ncbi:MAG: hypothetical protein EU981_00035 [Candidatus Liberibacter ctenarytainae]|uniref:DUF177 domain-containing protein n=1 Tax=Candidatus Liberibacter ctenarytainae TaxID=2020335 RepID=A0A937DIM6_9HYPH|nr:hypothetical protein [Candidatus Liberibacter ctenarytainae]